MAADRSQAPGAPQLFGAQNQQPQVHFALPDGTRLAGGREPDEEADDASDNDNESEDDDEDFPEDDDAVGVDGPNHGADHRNNRDAEYGIITNPFGQPSPTPGQVTFDARNMAAYPDEFQKQKVSSENGDNFVKAFYRRMERVTLRTSISSYFVDPTPVGPEVFPHINFNGSRLNAQDFQKVIEELPQQIRFEIESLDADCINPAITLEGLTEADAKRGRNMTISVNVAGTIVVGRKEDNVRRTFSDTFILVPNPKAATGRDRDPKRWLCNIYVSRIVGT